MSCCEWSSPLYTAVHHYITPTAPAQTDAPLKRAIKPQGGVGIVKAALEAYGFKPDPQVEYLYTKVRVKEA
jgi:pyruvate-formate lyase